MIVVSDTTPLNYLILIGSVEVLPRLFDGILVPASVLRELGHAGAPVSVRAWASAPPSWLSVADPSGQLPSTGSLDAGEADAISLAKERAIVDVLMDERRGRKVAAAEGLVAIPTLAVVERAAERGLLDLPRAVEALLRTTYRVRREILDAALERDAARRRPGGQDQTPVG